MKKILLVILTLLLAVSFSFAETFRQGEVRYTFHPSDIATKTSAYTVTSSDTQINVTASSADIVITLPSIASLRPNSKAYKILKTDATAYRVIVTPATGNTIGGESTRYITRQNGYIIIGMSSGNPTDWQISFESEYVAEDYEAGTVTINATQTLFGDVTVTGTTPLLTIGDAGAEDSCVVWDGNAQDYHACLDDTNDILQLGLGAAAGTTPILGMNATQQLVLENDETIDNVTDDTVLVVSNDENTTFEVQGFESKTGIFALSADQGDDAGDTWSLTAGTTGSLVLTSDNATPAVVTFTGTGATTTFGGVTPAIVVGDADQEDAQVNFDGNAQDYHIGVDDTDDNLNIGVGTALGTTSAIEVVSTADTYLGGTLVLENTDTPLACAGGTTGAIYFDTTQTVVCFCDGTSYKEMDDDATACQ